MCVNTYRVQNEWRQKNHVPLPCLSTLQKWLVEFVLAPNSPQLQCSMLKKLLASMEDRDRYCIVMLDEMDIMGVASYDQQLDWLSWEIFDVILYLQCWIVLAARCDLLRLPRRAPASAGVGTPLPVHCVHCAAPQRARTAMLWVRNANCYVNTLLTTYGDVNLGCDSRALDGRYGCSPSFCTAIAVCDQFVHFVCESRASWFNRDRKPKVMLYAEDEKRSFQIWQFLD